MASRSGPARRHLRFAPWKRNFCCADRRSEQPLRSSHRKRGRFEGASCRRAAGAITRPIMIVLTYPSGPVGGTAPAVSPSGAALSRITFGQRHQACHDDRFTPFHGTGLHASRFSRTSAFRRINWKEVPWEIRTRTRIPANSPAKIPNRNRATLTISVASRASPSAVKTARTSVSAESPAQVKNGRLNRRPFFCA